MVACCHQEYTVHNQRVLDVIIATDNCSFASCGGDHRIFGTSPLAQSCAALWDMSSCKLCQIWPRCATLITGSYDRTVRCWDLRSRHAAPIQTLTGAADSVSALALSAHEIIAGSIDGQVLTYDGARAAWCAMPLARRWCTWHSRATILRARCNARLDAAAVGQGLRTAALPASGSQHEKFKVSCCLPR